MKNRVHLGNDHVLAADQVGGLIVGAERYPLRPLTDGQTNPWGIDDCEIAFSLLFENSELRPMVFLQARVTVQMNPA